MTIEVTGYYRTRKGKREFVHAHDRDGNPVSQQVSNRMSTYNNAMEDFTKHLNSLSDEDLFKTVSDDIESGVMNDENDEYGQALKYITDKYPEWKKNGNGKLEQRDSDYLKDAITGNLHKRFVGSDQKDGEDPRNIVRSIVSYKKASLSKPRNQYDKDKEKMDKRAENATDFMKENVYGPLGSHTFAQMLAESRRKISENWRNSSGRNFTTNLFGGSKSEEGESTNNDTTEAPTKKSGLFKKFAEKLSSLRKSPKTYQRKKGGKHRLNRNSEEFQWIKFRRDWRKNRH